MSDKKIMTAVISVAILAVIWWGNHWVSSQMTYLESSSPPAAAGSIQAQPVMRDLGEDIPVPVVIDPANDPLAPAIETPAPDQGSSSAASMTLPSSSQKFYEMPSDSDVLVQ